ncbi:hypothetical protein RJT34_32770 [Clitoria ternatea]|uniref:Uncharacterized protein n=1 Tax=Clitoria ternatea TaxID=43366 RepID=A0AAN9EWP2_CLITE
MVGGTFLIPTTTFIFLSLSRKCSSVHADMSGMLAGVECARRRRLHPTADSTNRSLCLYTRNLHTQPPLSSSSALVPTYLSSFFPFHSSFLFTHVSVVSIQFIQERSMFNQAHPDDTMGRPAQEAKHRLDEKFTALVKSDYKQKTSKGLFHGLCRHFRS